MENQRASYVKNRRDQIFPVISHLNLSSHCACAVYACNSLQCHQILLQKLESTQKPKKYETKTKLKAEQYRCKPNTSIG